MLLSLATASQKLRIRLCAWMGDVEYGLCQRCSNRQVKPSCEVSVLYLGITQSCRGRNFTFYNLFHQLSILGYINMPAMHQRTGQLMMLVTKGQCSCKYFTLR